MRKQSKISIQNLKNSYNKEINSAKFFLRLAIFGFASLFFFASVLAGELALLIAGWIIACIETRKNILDLFLNINKYKPLLFFTITLSVIIIYESGIVGGLLLLILVWGYNLKNDNCLTERLKSYKQHTMRLIFSIIIVLISLTMVFVHFEETKQQKLVDKQQAFIENYPEPLITIVSSQGKQGDNKQYELEFFVTEYVNVKVNGEQVNSKNDLFKEIIDLKTPATKIFIEAKNEYKSARKTIFITRDETPGEKQKRAEKEAEQERLAEERKTREKFERESQDGDIASVCAQTYIKNHLKAPRSAKFPWSFGSVTPLGDNAYLVKNYVDAQNSFGAMMRTNYQCMVQVIDADNFICESVCEI